MMAMKCDRCNNFYDEYNGAVENDEKANSIYTTNKVKVDSEYRSVFKKQYDLCPKCMNSLINWFNMNITEEQK